MLYYQDLVYIIMAIRHMTDRETMTLDTGRLITTAE